MDPPSKTKKNTGDSSVIEEVDHDTAEKIEALNRSGRSRNDVQKIRVKVLLRRAKARTELGGWAELQGADEGNFLTIYVVVQGRSGLTKCY